jgi:hypothetical protein
MSRPCALYAALVILCAPAAARAEALTASCGALYERVVFNGLVDYERLGRDPGRERCREALARADLTHASVAERVAFWANAYNLLSMLAIAEEPERWSPMQGGQALFRDRVFDIAGRSMTLADEEKELAKVTRDPRVEFLLSCGARSCALLPSKLVAADGIEAAMELGARRWFARRDNLRVDRDAGVVELGQLLAPDWHGGDFDRAGTPLVSFVARFLSATDPKAAEALSAGRLRLVFRPYDWRVNRLPRAYPLP